MNEIENTRKEEQERTTKKKKIFLEEFNNSFGIITVACLRSGIDRKTYYRWIEDDYVFKAQCESIDKVQTDFVIDKLMIMIADGDSKGHAGSVHFYLSRRSSKFKEKLELSGDSALIDKYANVSDEELYVMLEEAKKKLDEASGKITEAKEVVKEKQDGNSNTPKPE